MYLGQDQINGIIGDLCSLEHRLSRTKGNLPERDAKSALQLQKPMADTGSGHMA